MYLGSVLNIELWLIDHMSVLDQQDGNDLPPPITFGVDTNTTVPSSQGSYFLNNEVKDLVVRFLKEYYTLYDSENRQPLVDAYHDSALFSMSVAFCPVSDYGSKQPNLGDYFSDSRNSLRIRDERNKGRRNSWGCLWGQGEGFGGGGGETVCVSVCVNIYIHIYVTDSVCVCVCV